MNPEFFNLLTKNELLANIIKNSTLYIKKNSIFQLELELYLKPKCLGGGCNFSKPKSGN